ncbi:sigma-70 family RNA polymerase sigma factor [Burkholderia glumae]|uniref:sigma-70 family RNA polymerase sigma factor n=1 Tax=Burkholderia glumae TaxID=337 RepID=UPI00148EA45F|nr:sigma-70 family RNA polymerase sigma factor [Burkholderia glumae]MCQ0033103.1 sigma-70 family RNA polymerase sigma factor [Burkholderia glumae]MCQ0036070.1 sigma-70 family RNA polymerase sigma factor [Burkholderia glumae]QJW79103.1 sigma-70 family RNA polymerase sigma factor [Burkholderia glumae]UVS85907.1 sigma-70 family RNA polymerase sigma factor [Burkholderia glumae]
MARPLRKLTRDGVLYVRREAVEAQITELEQLHPDELLARCNLWPKTVPGFVLTEALLHFVRIADAASAHREPLFRALMRRVQRALPKPDSRDGKTTDLSRMAIRDRVRDGFVDQMLADLTEYNEQLDYYEVNFNQALAFDRLDASRQVWTEENRSAELEDDDEQISAEVEQAVEHYDPFDADELDKKDYRRLLDGAIDTLPLIQKRIVEMLRLEIPIDSGDPETVTISKTLGKAEKTIRNQRDRAFATLRRRLERKEEVR